MLQLWSAVIIVTVYFRERETDLGLIIKQQVNE